MESKLNIYADNNEYKEMAIYGMAAVYSLIEKKISSHLGEYNLSLAKFNVLMVVKHHGGEKGISQVEISEKLLVTSSNTTRLIDRISKDGFVSRFNKKDDRRVNMIRITQKGLSVIEDVWPDYSKLIDDVTSSLQEEELKQFSNIISKWFKVLS